MDKSEIRKQMLTKRRQLSKKQQLDLSEMISKKLFESEIYKKNNNICVYQSFRGEVLCDKIKSRAFLDGKKVFLPVTELETHTIEFYRVYPDTKYREGAYHIMEPVLDDMSDCLTEEALILMPGLAFDRSKHRVGYGGGYYDRYLEHKGNHTTVALCYDFQIVEESLPSDFHDVLPDYILTDCEWIQ